MLIWSHLDERNKIMKVIVAHFGISFRLQRLNSGFIAELIDSQNIFTTKFRYLGILI